MEIDNIPQNREMVASIYRRYYMDIKMYLLSYTHDEMAAEDMLQDLFIKVMSLEVITLETAKNLLLVMAKRMIIDDARHKAFVRESHRDIASCVASSYEQSPAVRVEAKDILRFENKRLAAMPKKRANIYKMYKHDEVSADEIALQLNLSKRTVETHIYLSTKEMKQYLCRII